ncbi:MAG: hypothetical protein LBB87_00110 [Nitrososphaerota archaeon]|jgi:hypothetical protein|nr:hypothetical protein [Nitrososphaerota archaeon]
MTSIFEDGFESGNFNNWTTVNAATGTSISVSSLWARQGTNSALFNNNGLNNVIMYLQKSIPDTDEVYLRFYFKATALTIDPTGYILLAGLQSVSGLNGQLRIKPQSGNNYLQLDYYVGGTLTQKLSSTQILVDTVYCVELYFKRGASDGELRVYLNGAEVVDLASTGLALNSATNSVLLGSDWANYPGANNFLIFYDSVVVSDSYIGPIPEGGGGGDGFDGGTINSSLVINCKFPYLADQPAINSWITSAPITPSNYSAYLRFTNVNSPQHSTDIYGITFKDDTNTDVPAIGVNDSLLVRKNLFAQGYIRTAKSILRLEKSTPYTPPNAGASGNVNLGKANWPFDEIFATYGHIGDLEVPSELKTDYIKSLTNVDMTIKPWTGKKIKLDGDVQITGTLTGGAATPDWYNVPFIHLKGNMYLDAVATTPSDPKQFIEILSNPFDFTNWDEILDFMRQYDSGSLTFDTPDSAAIKFKSNIPGLLGHALTVSLFQVNMDTSNDPKDAGTAVCCSHSFLVRKDLFVNGKLTSIEGEVILHSGTYNNQHMREWGTDRRNPQNLSQPYKSYRPIIQAANWTDADAQAIDFIGPLKLQVGNVYAHEYVPIYTGGVYTSWLQKLPGTSGIGIMSTLLDVTGSSGNSGDVLTSTGDGAPTWQAVSGGGTGGVQKGTATTNATTGQVTVPLTTALPSGTLPIVTCTPIDSTGRTISLVITNRTNTNFTVRASIADSVNHQHKIGHAYATVANPISIASENNHVHTYAAYTDYQDVNHNHSIASVGDHTHGITHSNSTMNTGPASAGTSHTHTYTEYFVNNNVTNSGGGHTHGTGGNTGLTSINHRHSVAGTTGATSHTHTFSQMPTYMRETVLRLQNGTAHSIGSTLTMYQDTAVSTDLYTENAGGGSGSSLGVSVGVTFCWIAV